MARVDASTTLSPVGAIARAQDPDRFLCALFAPGGAPREALFALIAYNHELARAREASARTPMIALMRLQWWRDAVAEAAAGMPPRRHEVAAPLHAAIAAGLLDPQELDAMAEAREAEVEEAGIPTRDAFDRYLSGSSGGVAVATGRLLGGALAPEARAALAEAGALYGLAGTLRNLPALARQGRRCLLPLDVLAEQGIGLRDAIENPDAGPVRAAVTMLARGGIARLPDARAALRRLPRGVAAAALPLVLARRDLARLDAGRAVPPQRGLGDRLRVVVAGLAGRA